MKKLKHEAELIKAARLPAAMKYAQGYRCPEGLRLLLTPFPQQQFNQTADRRTERPSRGVVCFECHANRHTNASTHLVGDIRPQEFRHRIGTPSLRGVNIQRVFGSQRALKSVEDFMRVADAMQS